MLATLFVNAMIVIAEAIEDTQTAEGIEDIRRLAVKQLRMIAVGHGGVGRAPLTVSADPHRPQRRPARPAAGSPPSH